MPTKVFQFDTSHTLFAAKTKKCEYFFGRGGHKKMQKNDFFRKMLAHEKFIREFFQHRTMWKLTSGRFRKCVSYEAYGDFYASYHRSKSTHGWKSESVTIIMRCPKKKTRPQFWKLRLEIESALKQPCWSHADSISEPKTQNCGRVFFFGHRLSREFFLQISPNFDSQ